MKKIFLTLAIAVATCFASFADTTLSEAYEGLSKLSGMTEQNVGTVPIGQNTSIKNMKTTGISTQGNVESYRSNFIYMMENLPVRNMIIGANNQRELAAVYAVPAGNGVYNILIVKGDVLNGNFSASYGQTTKAGVNAIRKSQVNMDSDEIVFTTSPNNNTPNYLGMTK